MMLLPHCLEIKEMKRFLIEWETDFCEDFPEMSGEVLIEAETEEEAVKKFYALKIPASVIINVEEERKQTK